MLNKMKDSIVDHLIAVVLILTVLAIIASIVSFVIIQKILIIVIVLLGVGMGYWGTYQIVKIWRDK